MLLTRYQLGNMGEIKDIKPPKKVLNNGAYYVHHDWDKNQKVRGKVAVPCPCYIHEGGGFKLVIQNFI